MASLGSEDSAAIGTGNGTRTVRRGSPEYPPRLEHLRRPPARLWVRGPLQIPACRVVAIVGTRAATEYGRRMARSLALGLVSARWTVISGLARGIDAAAHRAALAAGGGTIGVLGCGIDRVYPAGHRDLYARLGREGLLLSEFEPGTPPLRHHFPRRNRIIAALADAVVVVQAPKRSGAINTANHALDLGRTVLAVPGPSDQAVSEGAHDLIRDGAGLATSAAAVLRELGEETPAGIGSSRRALHVDGTRSAAERRLCETLAAGPAGLEQLAAVADLPLPSALATLSRLEIDGAVRSLPGHRFELARP